MGSHICQDCGDQVVAAPDVTHYCRVRERRRLERFTSALTDAAKSHPVPSDIKVGRWTYTRTTGHFVGGADFPVTLRADDQDPFHAPIPVGEAEADVVAEVGRLRAALRGQIVRHDTPDGACWCWPLDTAWHAGWIHSPLCLLARNAVEASEG